MRRLPGRIPMTKAGMFGGDARLSYKGQVNKGKVNKGWVHKGRVRIWSGAPPRPGGPFGFPGSPCEPLGLSCPESLGLIRVG